MHAQVIYESMFGNTRRVAEAIAEGITASGATAEATSVTATGIGSALAADLVIVGAPTHAHSLSTPSSRAQAAEWAADPERELKLDPGATADGVREWIEAVPALPSDFIAFDTRADMIRLFTGAASASIHRHLARRGLSELVPAESFVVTTHNRLADGELSRARDWGSLIARTWAARALV